MNRGKKLVGMVKKKSNTTTKNCILIKHKKNENVENWSSTRNGIEVDLNRLNGVDIDDFIIEFADNDKINNNKEESDNILENNSMNLVYEQTVDNIVILDTQNVEESSGLKINTIDTFEVLENNLCDEITKDIAILDTQLYENEQSEEKNDDDNQDVSSSSVNYIGRGAKQKIESKKKRVAGLAYMGYSQNDKKIVQNKPRNIRKIGERCCHTLEVPKSTKSFMCGAFSENDRQDVFNKFWKMKTWDEKRGFVQGMVTNRPIVKRRKINEQNKYVKSDGRDVRLQTLNGQCLKVCRLFFLNTLNIGEDSFKRWTKKSTEFTEPGIDAEPAPSSRKLKKSIDVLHIKEWLHLLPKVPSHYCRQSTSKIYVESTFVSLSSMYKVFQEWCQEKNITYATKTIFCKTLNTENIKIHQPRKDQCDICVGYKLGSVSETVYNRHVNRKTMAREEKNKFKAEVSCTKVVITMDLQSVLLCPKTDASAMYYKQKLQLHNFTIYRLNDKDVTLYVWHEGNGSVSANEFTSCIIQYIDTLPNEVTEVILISDGCNYQNRNKTLACALSTLAKTKSITIEQLFLTKGHTMMEADNVHSTLEHYFKSPIYSPGDYISRMRLARCNQPYKINVLEYSFFKNYDDVCSLTSLRPGKKTGDKVVTDICKIQYTHEGEILYKTEFEDGWTKLPEQKKVKITRRTVIESQTLTNLYNAPLPISDTKFKDLQSLKPVIDKEYHPFYDNLPHSKDLQ